MKRRNTLDWTDHKNTGAHLPSPRGTRRVSWGPPWGRSDGGIGPYSHENHTHRTLPHQHILQITDFSPIRLGCQTPYSHATKAPSKDPKRLGGCIKHRSCWTTVAAILLSQPFPSLAHAWQIKGSRLKPMRMENGWKIRRIFTAKHRLHSAFQTFGRHDFVFPLTMNYCPTIFRKETHKTNLKK